MKMKFLALLLAGVAAVKAPDPVNFPGAAQALDPTGRYAVVWVAPDAHATDGGQQELLLRIEASGVKRHLLSFRRSATVFWAPGGNALAIKDRLGRDRSTVLVFFPDKPGVTDLDAELMKAFSPLPERTENHHVYLEVVRWLGPKSLRVRLRGYGEHDPEGFDELFDYELGGRLKRAVI